MLTPLFTLIALLILVTDGRPVLFRQKRVGKGGRDFWIYKFRTMRPLAHAEEGRFDAGDSRRVTPFGSFLRRTKLDELPQLINVVKGDMSLVGPRPEIRKWVEAYPEEWAFVLRARPGITDPAALTYRNEEEILSSAPDPETAYREEILPHKLALYREYIESRTTWHDIKILVQTVLPFLHYEPRTPK